MNEILPILAIVISLLSLGVSLFVVMRDRGRLKAECCVYRHEETDEYSHLYIKAVNSGRRPLTLHYLMGNYTEGEKSGYLVENGGLKLEEGEFHEQRIGRFDGMMIHTGRFGEKDCELIDLYYIDTEGKKYKVKDSKKCISKLWASKHPLGIRTHHN
ncbi:MAG: hypothetical protein ACTIM4_07880 [Marinomonas sp.]